MSEQSQTANLLLVEDDETDVMRLQRGLQKAKIANPLFVANTAEEAWHLLRGDGEGPACKKPYLILLDLTLPGVSGLRFLEQLRGDPEHGSAIVLVLTSSENETDRARAEQLGVWVYLRKSQCSEDFLEAVNALAASWRVLWREEAAVS